MAKVFRAEKQANGEWYALNQSHNNETTCSVVAADGGHIVQASEGNPIVNPQKGNLKGLKRKQQDFQRVFGQG